MYRFHMPYTSSVCACPWNVFPLIPHFYIVKIGFTGVYLFFLFLIQNIHVDVGTRGGCNVYPQSMF